MKHDPYEKRRAYLMALGLHPATADQLARATPTPQEGNLGTGEK